MRKRLIDSIPAGITAIMTLLLATTAFAGISVTGSEPGRLSLAYEAGTARRDSLRVDDVVYTGISLDGHTSTASSGYPALPVLTFEFTTPLNSQPQIDISNLEQTAVSGVRIPPVPVLTTDSQGFTAEEYREDPIRYALSGYRPDAFAALTESVEYGGVAIWTVEISPIRYDAHASTALFAESFALTVTWDGSGGPPSKPLPFSIINRDAYPYMAAYKPSAEVSPFASGDWYKVTFTGSGMYRITGAELASAGFPAGITSSNEIRMYYGGGKMLPTSYTELSTNDFREIAIKVNDGGDGTFDSSDSIVFYGEGISRFIAEPGSDRPVYQNHLYTDQNVVWITTSDAGVPKRMQSFGEADNAAVPVQTTYRSLRHLEQENNLELGNGSTLWYWVAVKNQSQIITFNAPDFVPGETTNVRVSYLNIENLVDPGLDDTPTLSVFVKEKEFPAMMFPTLTPAMNIDLDYESDLAPTGNIIQMRLKSNDTAQEAHLDWIEIEYLRRLRFEDNQLEFFWRGDGAATRLSVASVPGASVRVFDTSDPYDVRLHSAPEYDSVSKTLTFQSSPAAGQATRYTLWNDTNYRQVDTVARKTSAVIRTPSAANYIVIAHPQFLAEARRLADWRAHDSHTEPLTPLVVNVNDIYDAFSWGVFDISAIRDYLQYIWENGDPGRNYYCLLFGDTINKYKNLSGDQADQNFIPTYSSYHLNPGGDLITDDYFTWITPAHEPVYSIGRLCVDDPETASILVDKIIRYESQPEPGQWHNRVFLVADDEEGSNKDETIHTRYVEALDVGVGSTHYFPYSLEREKLLMINYPKKNGEKPEATAAFLKTFNEGFITGTYVGHGNKGLLAHEHLFVGNRDMEKLNNGDRLPLLGLFSCTTADFVQPDNVSLAEMLLLRDGGGSIGVIAATGETYSNLNDDLCRAYFIDLFDREDNPEMRIGRALQLAKGRYNNQNNYHYMVVGDPATRLMAPRYQVATAPLDSIALLETLDIAGSIDNGSTPAPFSGSKLYIKAFGPRTHLSYTTRFNTKVDYTQQGNVFYNGEVDLTGDSFDIPLVVPKDLTGSGDDTLIRFFATTGDPDTPEASGVISGFKIAGQSPDAPEDVTGPEISLAFDGKSFKDGDFISRQPVMKATLSDQSGINIVGKRGHNITLTIDDTETVFLTDNYRAINGYTSGILEYELPILEPGEHTIELSVYDAYNNAALKRVQAFVVGSETGDLVIQELLNWPNPMGHNGTTFTFNLTDDARSAEIKVYSQAGRMVDSMRFSAGYGFNQHFWTPPFTLANGVYFYKLTVQSVNGRKASKTEKLVVMK